MVTLQTKESQAIGCDPPRKTGAVHRLRIHGKFAENPPKLMPLDKALEIMGNPPKEWTPYPDFTECLSAARSLYENGLCLLSWRRAKSAMGISGPMERIWRAR